MPTTLETEWGEVRALTLGEAAKRMGERSTKVQWYADWDLLQSYMVTDPDKNGCIKAQALYIDEMDLAHAEHFACKFPEGSPWDRVLWARYEMRVLRERQEDASKVVQRQPQRRPQSPEPPPPEKPKKLPRELRNVDFYDELEARQPTRTKPPRAQPIRPSAGRQTIDDYDYDEASRAQPIRQSVQPSGRQPQRRLAIEEDDYYAEPDEETVKDNYPKQKQKQKQPMVDKMRRGRWF